MIELKTLKDFKKNTKGITLNLKKTNIPENIQPFFKEFMLQAVKGTRNDLIKKLQQEAIKQIKDIRNNLDENVPGECKDCIGLICWIKHFFNISEEDLK